MLKQFMASGLFNVRIRIPSSVLSCSKTFPIFINLRYLGDSAARSSGVLIHTNF